MCYRKHLNPHQLNKYEKFHYLEDTQCDADCPYENCGLIIHTDYCNVGENVDCRNLKTDSDDTDDNEDTDSE